NQPAPRDDLWQRGGVVLLRRFWAYLHHAHHAPGHRRPIQGTGQADALLSPKAPHSEAGSPGFSQWGCRTIEPGFESGKISYARAVLLPRPAKSSISSGFSNPTFNTSTQPRPSTKRIDSACFSGSLRHLPAPTSFMPVTALPAACSRLRIGTTLSAGPSICTPSGLIRVCTHCTHGS